jgi:hypothetical protein
MRTTARNLPTLLLAGALALAPLGCNALLGNDPWALDDGGDGEAGTRADAPFLSPDGGSGPSRDSSGTSMPNDSSAPPEDSTVPPFDTEPPPFDSAPVDTGPIDTGLNPGLVVPPPGTQCMPSEGDIDCPAGDTCRISSVNLGTCDSYWAGPPAHNGGWPCTLDSDCSDTLQCWMGECKALCPLGMNCGGGCECLAVGNDTTGICCPGL